MLGILVVNTRDSKIEDSLGRVEQVLVAWEICVKNKDLRCTLNTALRGGLLKWEFFHDDSMM